MNADLFNGDPLSWMKWFTTFQATIDRAQMTSPKKMIHLQSVAINRRNQVPCVRLCLQR